MIEILTGVGSTALGAFLGGWALLSFVPLTVTQVKNDLPV